MSRAPRAPLSSYQRRLFGFLGVATFFEGYDFFALTRTEPLTASARLTGIQKWLREPCSLNASVLRCRPIAAARNCGAIFSPTRA